MFSTFSTNADNADRRSPSHSAPRPKRTQVARACDWCRLNRIKCDDKQPCRNCQNRGVHCSNTKPIEETSLPAANREIKRLRNKVKDLQEQIKTVKEDAEIQLQAKAPNQLQLQTGCLTPPLSDAVNGSFSYAELSNSHEGWQGLQNTDAIAGELYYGPMSSPYFVARVTRYLSQALNQPLVNTKLEAFMAHFSHFPPSPCTESKGSDPKEPEGLTRSQEETFLNLFWQSFHCVYPIISEPDFREYYALLWSDPAPGGTRKASSFVDILLAVCMQYGSTFLISDDDHRGGNDTRSHIENANMAGHAFFQRAQRQLQNELEHPSIMVLQSYIYSTIYLYHTSLLNAAHINLAVALRIAHALRLHIRPLNGTPAEEHHLRGRIWWTLYRLDSQLSMTLGRPPLIQMSHISCGLPGDNREHCNLSGTVFSHEDISWLSFHVQCTKLILAVQGVQAAFQRKCSQLLNGDMVKDIYDDPHTTETLAEFLGREMVVFHAWVQDVPTSLRNARKGVDNAFSTDRTALNLDPYSPLWLQRQRLLLEIMYHHLQMSTLRPFLRLPSVTSSVTFLADNHSISCLNHAMAITCILNQVLSETDILRGWTPVLQYGWDAILCTLGFLLANPVCPSTPSARKSLQTAIRTLELVGNNFPAAKTAAQIVREVNSHAERLIDSFQSLTRQQGQRSSQSSFPMTQNSTSSGTQTPIISTANQTAFVPVSSENTELSSPVMSRNQRMHGFELHPITTDLLTEFSSTIRTTEPPSGVIPSTTSVDMVTASGAPWMDTSVMMLGSWADFMTNT